MSMDVLDAPPVSMLLTFSGHFRSRRDEIAEIQQINSTGDGHCFYVLHGGRASGVADVFNMMQSWCDGNKTVPTYPETRLFFSLFQLYEAAKVLQVPDPMIEMIQERLKEVIETEAPDDEDLAEGYDDFPAFPEGHEARRLTLYAWMEGYANDSPDLEEDVSELFKDIPDLQRDVNDAIATRKQRWGLDQMRDSVEEIGEGQRAAEATTDAGLGRWSQVTLPLRCLQA